MKFLRLPLFLLSLMTTLVVSAYDFEANGLYFNIVSAGDLTCALTDGPSDHKYTGALVIPDEVEYSGKKLKVFSIECELPEVSSVKLGKNIARICTMCFDKNHLITSIILPSSITEIGHHAFSKCTSLTSVKWEGDMVLSSGIFDGCKNLKNVSYKSVCKIIPNEAFYECPLISFDLSSVEEIHKSAFKGCTSLNRIILSSIKVIHSEVFDDCGNISLLTLGPDINNLNYYGGFLKNCNIDSLAILPSDTLLIASSKFLKETKVKSLYIGRDVSNPNSLTDIVFNGSDITFVRIGALVTKLQSSSLTGKIGYFEDCKNLSKITFEGTDIEIEKSCFKGTKLKDISLPVGTNRLGKEVFPDDIEIISFGSDVHFADARSLVQTFENIKGSSTLKQISFLSVTPPSYPWSFENNVYTSTKLLVPYGSKESYKKVDPWRNFWNIEEMPGVNTEKVEIGHVNTSLHVGDTIKLIGTKYPANSIDTIQWNSSDVKIATISYDGLVTAVAPGKTTITAISGKVSATCEITVLPIAAEKIVLSHDNVSINKSDTIKITATISPETTTDKTINWTSSDEKIATVSKEGIVTAISAGTVTITATCGEISAICEITVYEPNIAIEFTDNTLSIIVEGSNDSVYISVFTVFGQCVYRQFVDTSVVIKEDIDLSKLPSGTYIVQAISGAMNSTKRIVKS